MSKNFSSLDGNNTGVIILLLIALVVLVPTALAFVFTINVVTHTSDLGWVIVGVVVLYLAIRLLRPNEK